MDRKDQAEIIDGLERLIRKGVLPMILIGIGAVAFADWGAFKSMVEAAARNCYKEEEKPCQP